VKKILNYVITVHQHHRHTSNSPWYNCALQNIL